MSTEPLYLGLGPDPDMPLYRGLRACTHWLLNTKVSQGILAKDAPCVQVGSQKSTLSSQSLREGSRQNSHSNLGLKPLISRLHTNWLKVWDGSSFKLSLL